MKKNVFEVSIGTNTQSFSNPKGTESKGGASFSTARKLTHEILRPRETSLGPSTNFVVYKPSPLDSLPSLETPRKNPIFKGSAHIIDSLTKLNEFRSGGQGTPHARAEPPAAPNARLELAKNHDELDRLGAEKRTLERGYRERVQQLERENEFLRQKAERERGGSSKVSLRLLEIESQNSKIIENIQTAKASLVEKERNYVEKIQAMKRETLALEQDLFQTRKRAYDSEISASKLKNLEEHYDLTLLELARQKKKSASLAESERFLQEHLQALQAGEAGETARLAQLQTDIAACREQNAALKAEVADLRQTRAREQPVFAQRIEELTQRLSGRNEELRLLSDRLRQAEYGLEGEGEAEALEALDGENLLLSQTLNKMQKKYEVLQKIAQGDRSRPNISFAERPRPRTEQKEPRRECYAEAAVDHRLILSSTETFEPYAAPSAPPQPRPALTAAHECSFKKYDAKLGFQEDSQGATSLGQNSGEDISVAFTPGKPPFRCERNASAHREAAESRGLTQRQGCSPIKRVIFNHLLSDDNDFSDKETVRNRYTQDYSLQDEATLMSADASVVRPGANLFYPTSFPHC